MTLGLDFSRRGALVGGVLVPCLEGLRRWHQWADPSQWPFILDDFLVGGLLVVAAMLVKRNAKLGRVLLVGGWGVAAGMMYESFFGQLLARHDADPSGLPTLPMVAVKGLLFALCIAGLVDALRAVPNGAAPRVALRRASRLED